MKLSRSTWLSILLGVAYGVTLRLLMAVPNLEFSGLVSISFFVIVPIATGFIVVITGDPARSRRLKYAFFAPWIAVLCFLLTTAILMLEGAVCIGLALPGFLVLSSLGGLAACWLVRRDLPKAGALYCVIALPLLLSPVESMLPVDASVDTVVTRVTIVAPPDVVWKHITDVGHIDRNELSFGLTRLLGMPQPLEAHMEITPSGWVRNTRWERGVSFREIITEHREGAALHWTFDFPPSAVPEGILDEHVQIGGRYFALLDGGYSLEPDGKGATRLTIRTTYQVSARPALYSRYWARLIMSDFHRVILNLIRDRSERSAG